ncbi:MAG: BspA family leucine-rich repeat surface protein, partial [Ruminococcus sp.]|nr:BspA family leucine-rich repeat surface protein [Ruminococcus sp.]
SIVLSEGTLTLRSNVIKKEVQAYANNEEVKNVVAEEGSVLPADCSNMFENFKALSIDLSQADSSNVTSMSYMFSYCNSLKSLDLSSFNTSKVPKMDGLFYNCVNLTALDIRNFNISNVTSMTSMFSNSYKLKTIIVGYKWDTSRVNSSNNMFKGCTRLVGGNGTVYNSAYTNAEYARIDTPETPGYLTVKTTMEGDTLILSGNIDKKEVQTYAYKTAVNKVVAEKGSVLPADCSKMFENFRALSIDLSQVDSSKVKNMEKMFFECNGLQEINLSGFDTSNVTNMALTFCRCYNLKALDLSDFDTSKVVDMRSMFTACHWLNNLDISNFNTSKVKNMRYMFSECKRLKTIDVGRFNTSNVKDMSYMFDNCQAYETLDLRNFDTSNVTDMNSMFCACYKLKKLDVSSFNTSNVINMNHMFGYCNKLTTIVVGNNWNTSKVNSSYDMFSGCISLVGGNGTAYIDYRTNAEYARIDTPEKPGYLTAAAN